MDAETLNKLSPSQRETLMEQVKQQMMIASTQELLTKIGEKCFTKCIPKPGSSLDNSEQKCLAMCMDRYMDSWNLVSKVYSSRLMREKNRM